MPSSLVQRIRIRQNAFWFRSRQALAFGRRLIRLSRLRQTGRFPHVFFIQTRQGRANLAPPSIFICRSGDCCFGGSMRNRRRALKHLRFCWMRGLHGSGPFRLRRFKLRRFRLRGRRRRRDRLWHWTLRRYRHRPHRARRLRMSRPRNRQPLVEILGLEPRLGTQALYEIVVPQPDNFDIEGPLQPLVDQLHPVAGNSPLPPDPKDVAMQCHFALRYLSRSMVLSPPI